MKTVILCGGKGTRMGNIDIPKPLVEIGGKPILWHIMNIYSHYGYNDYVLCLGHLGDKIAEYFAGEPLKRRKELNTEYENWQITLVDTGKETNTGGRIKLVERYIDETFFATYGDGLADINLKKLLEFHERQRKTATLTAVRTISNFGILKINSNSVSSFVEKPKLNDWINGGFFVFEPKIFDFMTENDVLENDVFKRLIKNKELAAYKHNGFWKCMDTYKENVELNELWRNGKAGWMSWR